MYISTDYTLYFNFRIHCGGYRTLIKIGNGGIKEKKCILIWHDDDNRVQDYVEKNEQKCGIVVGSLEVN